MGRRVFSTAVIAVCLVMLGSGCGPYSRYSVRMYHGPGSHLTAKSTEAQPELGRVYADDPYWETNGWRAWVVVTKDGKRVYDPDIQWTVDTPECVMIHRLPERTDYVRITAYPGSSVGRGRVYATYCGVTAEMELVSYGHFELVLPAGGGTSTGWAFDAQPVTDATEADIYASCGEFNPRQRTLHAPNGIQMRGAWSDLWTFLEGCREPALDGFVTTTSLENQSIYEVIGRDGRHYRVSCTGEYMGPDGQRLFMAWAPFW